MAKLKTRQGYRFIKELGGAIRRSSPSSAAKWLVNQNLINGRVLDYGCGFGFDADHFGWMGYDPYYRQSLPTGRFDTIVCNHVLNMLTRDSRRQAIEAIQGLMSDRGVAFLIVPRNIPVSGKVAMRKRIQNYVVLSLPSMFSDEQFEIYRLDQHSSWIDRTKELEDWLKQ